MCDIIGCDRRNHTLFADCETCHRRPGNRQCMTFRDKYSRILIRKDDKAVWCGACKYWARTEAPEQIMGLCNNEKSFEYKTRKHIDGDCFNFEAVD